MGVFFAMALMLGPADFGTMAILLAWISIGTFLVDAGFGAALVQRNQLTEKHLTTAFVANVVIAVISFTAMWTLAPVISRAYAEPLMVDLLRVLALAILLSSAVATKVSLAQREMRFKQLAIRDSSAVVIGGVAGITFALAGLGVWSLVIQTLSGAAISAVMTWQIVPWVPNRRALSLKAIRDLSGYSGRMLLFGLLKIAAQNVDVMLIGYTMSVAMAGLYSLAFKMIIKPTGAISAAFGAYFFPAFSRLQDNRDILAIEYERALKLVGYGCIPFLLIFYFAVDQFVASALPAKWIAAVPVAKVLTFVALAQLFIAIFGELIKAVGRPGLLIWWSVGLLVSTATAIMVGSHWGLVGIAAGIAVVHAVGLLACLSIGVRLTTPPTPTKQFGAALGPVFMFLCVIAAGEFLTSMEFSEWFSPWVRLFLILALSGVVIAAFRRQVSGWFELARK